MGNKFSFPATLTPDTEDGGFVVTFRDVPEAITQGNSEEECIEEAMDCLEEAIAGYIDDGREIPLPSGPQKGEVLIPLPAQMAFKAAIYMSIKEIQITNTELARRMKIDEKEARRILDPHHPTKLPTMERALKVLGKKTYIHVL